MTIMNLDRGRRSAIGFKVVGQLSADDVLTLSNQIEDAIVAHGKPIGVLVDISEMDGATWAARWDEMRFLQKHNDQIARLAIISNDEWQEIREMILVATAAMQAETSYFLSSEMDHAWHWVKRSNVENTMAVRIVHPGKRLFSDYTPEFTGL